MKYLAEIPVNKATSFKIDDKEIVTVAIKPINFMTFSSIIDEVEQSTSSASPQVLIQKSRFLKQVDLITDDNKTLKLSPISIMALPPKIAIEAKKAISASTSLEVEPKMLNKGDGITSPIHIKLAASAGSVQTEDVNELEIFAPDWTAIESVLAETNKVVQARELIKNCATPVLNNSKMLRLSEALLNSISVVDGLYIATEVVPVFTE